MTTGTAQEQDGVTCGVNQAWEEVLAAVEEDVRRTEALLAEPIRLSDTLLGVVAPAQAQLPVNGPSLPPLDGMPAVPAELGERIRDLRVRIVALQIELRNALAAMGPGPSAPLARGVRPVTLTAAAPAHYFDSRV